MAINGRRSDAQECHVWVNAARFRFLERVFDCLYGTLYEAVRLRIVGRGRHMCESPLRSKVFVRGRVEMSAIVTDDLFRHSLLCEHC